MSKRPLPKVDFLHPQGAPALYSQDSLHWHVFKNPVALFVGGITAVLLELAEERVRTGVWEHSIFPTDPLTRMERTGLMAHVSVYAPVEVAEKLIRGVVAMHARVEGKTPKGTPYRANDPELLDWVQCTVSYGFMEAYAAYCRPLTDVQRDRFYKESVASARLFLAHGAPQSQAEQRQLFEKLQPHLEAHPIVQQFLGIVKRTPAVPWFLRPLQSMMLRAGVDLLPEWLRERLALHGAAWKLRRWERSLLKNLGAALERLPIPNFPPTLASRRMGLPANHLYRGPGASGDLPTGATRHYQN
ncbi:uncharacterized protein (DUF2236 family) [Povalibacter uvarum]|uniref:Uncharacterized protein (DUF2236 family) n=1 Tax=Povalibacter uvarum TaxID=732238 RepID=A0A841HGK2_9GAMM|nr:oxygenase MpaB family protein [Povalibacter uvarum]MBB6092251.1 uncharacterized protein (DUF2236 family) [Povalibacter uvarum]